MPGRRLCYTAATRREEEATDRYRESSSTVNKRIDELLAATKALMESVSEHEENLNMDPFSRGRVERLKRMLVATERGVAGCRMVRM